MAHRLTISAHELAQLEPQLSIDLIDVRTPAEFRELRPTIARNVPLDTFDPHNVIRSRSGADSEPLYLICKSGARAAKAQKQLVRAGFENVICVEGGTDAWLDAGLPVVRGKKMMSLERQVRIAAGLIVLLGAVAALLTGNVYFAVIPALVGAGLTFAGITDNCAMGMIIAKMPWNRVAEPTACPTE